MNYSIRNLLEEIRDTQTTSRDVGTRFEELVSVYLKNDPEVQAYLDEVWTFQDWVAKYRPDESSQDRGIDLVASRRPEHGGGFVAVQAKYRAANTSLQKKDIDSFFTNAKTLNMDELMFVDSTQASPSKNFVEVIKQNNIRHVNLTQLEQSVVDWSRCVNRGEVVWREEKTPRPHQKEAVKRVIDGLQTADRGQIVMACGTGKTYTGLLLAEKLCGKGSQVLVLVPSLALMSQMIREWHADKTIPFRSFSVCSDVEVGRKAKSNDDRINLHPSELIIPPTTDAQTLARNAGIRDENAMTVIFATYHSIEVIHEAQDEFNLPEFQLILCDEAHRTTGQIDADEEGSVFVRVHDAEYVKAKKRLYMTATPRIYSAASKTKAQDGAIELCSMDNPEQFGEVLYYKSFAWAVENDLLSDYRVIVLALDEATINQALQKYLESDDCDIRLDDATKIIGCCKALMKETSPDRAAEFAVDPDPSIRALAFCNTIRNSQKIESAFKKVVSDFNENVTGNVREYPDFNIQHVDGTMGSSIRTDRLKWLGDNPAEDEVRILSNVRCLGEGVDVPALDAIVFFHARKSQIDVVQAVGRVMRKASGKKYGYVILPVAVPSGISPEESLNNNKTYETVWQILNALRSHDERLEADINRLHLEGEHLERIKILLAMPESASAELVQQSEESPGDNGKGSVIGKDKGKEIELPFDQVKAFGNAMFAQIVKKCGDKMYWEDWAADVGRIAQTQITRIGTVLATDEDAQKVFERFLKELQQDLNPSVNSEQAIELLAQHVITRPIFEALFAGHAFVQENSVSKSMDKVVSLLDEKNLDKETDSLENFYESVTRKVKDTGSAKAKQNLVKELYDKFFRRAFPRATEMLGIAFTPVEIVDYVIHSVEHLLNKHFDLSMSDEGVHIIDPFVGTGTFVTRLLQSGIICPEDLSRKYQEEIHANEIVLLAYYVAGINIEAVYHEEREEKAGYYEPFTNLVLQDTFQGNKQTSLENSLFPMNHESIDKQSKLPLTVILGNPPYSKGQKRGNDDAQNIKYEQLDQRIAQTYVRKSSAGNKNSLYDSYVKAYRWASDRIEDRGIVGFVTGAGWLDGFAAAGMRACFTEEFDHIYVVNLRGNARLHGEAAKKEGEVVFGQASRSSITVTFLVKQIPSAPKQASIHYHDIGDYLKRNEKFAKLNEFQHVGNTKFQSIKPFKEHDWINQRNPQFNKFFPLFNRHDSKLETLFQNDTQGVCTSRDAWAYNFSKTKLSENVQRSMDYFNEELERYISSGTKVTAKEFVTRDSKKIAYTDDLINRMKRYLPFKFYSDQLYVSEYRPFAKQWCYYDRDYITRVYQTPKFWLTPETRVPTICVHGPPASEFSSWFTAVLPDRGLLKRTYCYPFLAPRTDKSDFLGQVLTPTSESIKSRRTIISSGKQLLAEFYPDLDLTDEQCFYYVYGILQCDEYVQRFHHNLVKEVPRIPVIQSPDEFLIFSEIGKQLAELHMNYEDAEEYSVTTTLLDDDHLSNLDDERKYRVEKMKYPDKQDRSTIQYNPFIRVSGIPAEAYEFQVNGRSLIEWVMDRQQIRTDKRSGIVNDPNDFAKDTTNDPEYPLKLLKKAITVGLRTRELKRSMPLLRIHKKMGG